MQTTQTPRPIDWDAHREEKYTFWGASTDAQPNTPKSKYNGAVLGKFASATIVYIPQQFRTQGNNGKCWGVDFSELLDFEASFLAYTKEECLAHILRVFEQHNLKPLISYLPTQPRPTVRGDWSMQIK